MMHALLARARGASRIFIRDLSEERMQQCTEVCAEFIPVYGENLKEEIMKLTDNRGIDVCIVACPSGRAQEESLELMSMNGRILFFGGLPQGRDKVLLPSNLIIISSYPSTGLPEQMFPSTGQQRKWWSTESLICQTSYLGNIPWTIYRKRLHTPKVRRD